MNHLFDMNCRICQERSALDLGTKERVERMEAKMKAQKRLEESIAISNAHMPSSDNCEGRETTSTVEPEHANPKQQVPREQDVSYDEVIDVADDEDGGDISPYNETPCKPEADDGLQTAVVHTAVTRGLYGDPALADPDEEDDPWKR